MALEEPNKKVADVQMENMEEVEMEQINHEAYQ